MRPVMSATIIEENPESGEPKRSEIPIELQLSPRLDISGPQMTYISMKSNGFLLTLFRGIKISSFVGLLFKLVNDFSSLFLPKRRTIWKSFILETKQFLMV